MFPQNIKVSINIVNKKKKRFIFAKINKTYTL